jgi:hypothetical protein
MAVSRDTMIGAGVALVVAVAAANRGRLAVQKRLGWRG